MSFTVWGARIQWRWRLISILFFCGLDAAASPVLCLQAGAAAHHLSSATDSLYTNNFEVERGLFGGHQSYFRFFPTLPDALLRLKRGHHWVDLGAGSGKAIAQYHKDLEGEAKTTAISFIQPEQAKKHVQEYPETSRYLHGRLFEEIPNKNIGKADVITDLYGVLSYTRNLTGTLEKVLDLLKTDGYLYIFADLGIDRVRIKDPNMNHQYRYSDGSMSSSWTLQDYLVRVPGLEIDKLGRSFDGNTKRMQPANERYESNNWPNIRIKKTAEFQPGSIPKLEFLRESDAHLPPPTRWFVIKSSEDINNRLDD